MNKKIATKQFLVLISTTIVSFQISIQASAMPRSYSSLTSGPSCAKALLSQSHTQNFLDHITPAAQKSMGYIKTFEKSYPLQKTNRAKNKVFHQHIIEANSLIDTLVILHRVSWNKQNSPEEQKALGDLSDAIIKILLEESKIPPKILLNAIGIRQNNFIQMINHKSLPIGFLTELTLEPEADALSAQIEQIQKYAPKFAVKEPSYEKPYGAETTNATDSAPQINGKKIPMGFKLPTQNTSTQTPKKLPTIGFVQPEQFIDDHFLFTATFNSENGELELMKKPVK